MSRLSRWLKKAIGKKWYKKLKTAAAVAAVVYTGGALAGAAAGTGAAAGGAGALSGTWGGLKAFGSNIWSGMSGGAQVGTGFGATSGHFLGNLYGTFTPEGQMMRGFGGGYTHTPGINPNAPVGIPGQGQQGGLKQLLGQQGTYVPGGMGGGKWGEWMNNYGGWIQGGINYMTIREQSKLAKEQMRMASTPLPSQLRFSRDLNLMDSIMSTSRGQLTSKFGTHTLQRFGITPHLVEAEALQARAERRREIESIEDESARMAARSGLFGQGALAGIQAETEVAGMAQDAAIGLAAEKSFANQIASLNQQYQQGVVHSMNMEQQQRIQMENARYQQSVAKAGMWQLLGNLAQGNYGNLFGAPKAPEIEIDDDIGGT